MKKSALTRIIIWSIVAVLLLGVFFAVMFGEDEGFPWRIPYLHLSFGKTNYSYSDTGFYSGDFEVNADKVDSIDIDWVAGSVTVSSYGGNVIKVSESGNINNESDYLRYRITDGKVTVKFRKSGRFKSNNLKKDLIVYLPGDIELKDLNVKLVSSSLDVSGFTVDNINVETVSGKVGIYGTYAEELKAESVSGKIVLENAAEIMDIENVSGSVDIDGGFKEADVSNVSGTVRITALKVPKSIDVETVSGGTYIFLPEGTGFTLEAETLSGEISAGGKKLGKSGTNVIGDGSVKIGVESVSGSASIKY